MIDELAQTYAHYVALRRELSLWAEQSIRRDGPYKASCCGTSTDCGPMLDQ